jgi:histone deacetylase complex regulatory component SIN3
MVVSRDFSRRHHNLLCKPLSEFETHNFKKISYSYFLMPPDFPRPLCFGRVADSEWASMYREVFNEDYSSLPQGSESFKFKMKNQFEEVLFKVEDEMYNMDFELGNLKRAMDVFAKEKNAIEEMTEEQKA